MALSRSPSTGHKSRPARVKPSFRDDSGLVALRYEKTKPAEPPIPLPPTRALFRTTSVCSTPRSITSASSSRSTPSSYGPVVVIPPTGYLSTIAPPREQHPALRCPSPAAARAIDDWKRDSGHAPTTASATIHEEDCEDDDRAVCARPKTLTDPPSYAPPPVPRGPSSRTSWDKLLETATPRRASSSGFRLSTPEAAPDTPSSAARLCSPRSLSSSSSPPSPSPLPRRLAKKRHTADPSGSLAASLQVQRPDETWAPPPPLKARSPMRGSATPVGAAGPAPAIGGSHKAPHQHNHLSRIQQKPLPPPPPRSATGSTTATSDSPVSTSTSTSTPNTSTPDYAPLAVRIPTPSLLDDGFMTAFTFSKRGSLVFAGPSPLALDAIMDDRANAPSPSPSSSASLAAPPASPSPPRTLPRPAVSVPPRPVSGISNAETMSNKGLMAAPDIRVLSVDVEKESQKVRSLYQAGDDIDWEDGARRSYCERLEPTPEFPAEEAADDPPAALAHRPASLYATPKSASFCSQLPDNARRDTELAGGLEDWEDVDGADVDRYGFINVLPPSSRNSTPTDPRSAHLSPRRKNLLQKKDPMGFPTQLGGGRFPSRKISARSLKTQDSEISLVSARSSRSVIRQAGNLLPHNRNRRWMDEAGDMLTVSPNLQDVLEGAEVERISEALKRKEWERSEKWRRMAKILRGLDQGQGMEFEFDMHNPKLIERTWKGIPDRWRAAAWWSFLASSAKEQGSLPAADDLIVAFHALQEKSSPDDVQIDLDVPRTISRHIMFRRRYRGGQRLLFRVLHALSIYCPETGYVQGMASLAATLLCYFDEEKCFVMLVRMWQLRGLSRLYLPGFEGLMTALREFETTWLNKEVAKKLTELCVDTTAYGTRWYLTLFNLSIPFPAQLRVWDVFLLLGTGGDDACSSKEPVTKDGAASASGLEVLHATGAALIQALREVLLDSDFENAMKALTSWIPIKDEDLLMKVMKAEWKTHQGKKRT
ncbi:hypothetical protein HIM_00135 [Hirsutella minnesotensis 3608]|nr:hypothetical protein HIM_00135 [Hirsutella minnesotensis 3608]